MKKLLIIKISLLAMILAGCNFYTDVDADWNADDGEDGSDCDQLLVLLEAEDEEARRGEIAAEYARCAGVEPGNGGPQCDESDGPDCEGQQCDEADGDCHNEVTCGDIENWITGGMGDEPLDICYELQIPDDRCEELLEQCRDDNGNSGGNTGNGLCEMAYDALADVGIDPDSLTPEEAYDLCMSDAVAQSQNGAVDESICSEIANHCFEEDANSGGGSQGETCDQLIQQASGMGVDEPTTEEEASELLEQCRQVSPDPDVCERLVACYGFMP